MKTLKFLKLFENFMILNFLKSYEILKVLLKFYENFEFLKKIVVLCSIKPHWSRSRAIIV
jgi:hypothetical protein